MKMLIKAAVLFTGMLLIGSCESSTENKKDNEPDSTTQNFTFTEYEFGDGGSSSYFNDVWIFDENNIWVVGNVFTEDSTDGNIYHWDGIKWKAIREGGGDMYGLWGINGKLYIAVGQVWKYENGNVVKYVVEADYDNGERVYVHHLWGSSESNIWGVGPWGTLVHYNGSKWTKLDVGTDVTFRGITGIKEKGAAYALGYSVNEGTMIYELKEGTSQVIYSTKELFGWAITYAGNSLIMSDVKIWKYDLDKKEAAELHNLPIGHSADAIGKAADNDIYYFGSSVEKQEYLTHYNGKRYKDIGLNVYLNNQGGAFAIKDLAVRAGYSNNKAYLSIIRRNLNK